MVLGLLLVPNGKALGRMMGDRYYDQEVDAAAPRVTVEEEQLEEGGAGLRCYSCGSLLAPAAADPPCSASNSSWRGEVRSCGPGQACLLYTWARGAHTGEWSCCRAYFQFVFGAFL